MPNRSETSRISRTTPSISPFTPTRISPFSRASGLWSPSGSTISRTPSTARAHDRGHQRLDGRHDALLGVGVERLAEQRLRSNRGTRSSATLQRAGVAVEQALGRGADLIDRAVHLHVEPTGEVVERTLDEIDVDRRVRDAQRRRTDAQAVVYRFDRVVGFFDDADDVAVVVV